MKYTFGLIIVVLALMWMGVLFENMSYGDMAIVTAILAVVMSNFEVRWEE